jgi:hypothetical protein
MENSIIMKYIKIVSQDTRLILHEHDDDDDDDDDKNSI